MRTRAPYTHDYLILRGGGGQSPETICLHVISFKNRHFSYKIRRVKNSTINSTRNTQGHVFAKGDIQEQQIKLTKRKKLIAVDRNEANADQLQ